MIIGWQGWRAMSSDEIAYRHLLPFWVILKVAFRVFWEVPHVYNELVIKKGRCRPTLRRDAVLYAKKASALVGGKLMPAIAGEGQKSYPDVLVVTLLGGM